ncbi:MAG: ABC transporter ATP-binding protein [Acidimicrobiia bacterium]
MTGELVADVVVRRSDSFRLELKLSIQAGTTAALLGPNGAGKSTAVWAISGLRPIDEGRITLGEAVLDDPADDFFVPAEERRVGVVFQDYLLFPHLTVLENISFGMRSRGVGRDEAMASARRWLERFGLEDLEGRRPGDLSGGQAQRVALARALVTEPDLLLLDEPLSALDVTTRTDLRHTLAEHLTAFEGPRLLITHDPTEAFLLADHIWVIEDGAITQSGSADDIRLHPRTTYAADLAGSNLVLGRAHDGTVDTGTLNLHAADVEVEGPVLVTIHPNAISVYPERPEGSPRNSWETTVERVERLGSRVRLRTGAPLPLTVEVTEGARAELGLEPGTPIWIGFKATEISVQPE